MGNGGKIARPAAFPTTPAARTDQPAPLHARLVSRVSRANTTGVPGVPDVRIGPAGPVTGTQKPFAPRSGPPLRSTLRAIAITHPPGRPPGETPCRALRSRVRAA